MMDKKTSIELANVVRAALRQTVELYEEKWLSADQLCEQFSFFTRSWLKRFGSTLPRTQIVVRDQNGEEHKSGWAYPRNEIQKMIQDGRSQNLRVTVKN